MVSSAQEKAREQVAAQAQEQAKQEVAERDAVHVQYVPQIVKDEISKQVVAELRPQVAQDVVAQAKQEKWGVPGALPDWVGRISWSGDLRVRYQLDNFASDNPPDGYPDYLTINNAGGFSKVPAGNAYFNTTVDRERTRLRLRLGALATLDGGWSVGLRLATGSLTIPVSTNQTVGQYGDRYQFAVDQAYLKYQSGAPDVSGSRFSASLGRLPNPWLSTNLVWDRNLQFEGLAASYEYRRAFLTLGAFPLQEVERSKDDKWLFGAQLGFKWSWGDRSSLKLAAAAYNFEHITGIRNAPGSTLLNYTAPPFMQKGNSLFDIYGGPDSNTNLYALAAEYRLLDLTAFLELPVGGYSFTLTGDYVTNRGFSTADVLHRLGYASLSDVPEMQQILFAKQANGYKVEAGFGSRKTGTRGAWQAGLEYRYLERDAVVDAFTDADFHLGGTAAKGYVLNADWWLNNRVWMELRYFSTDAIINRQRLGDDPITHLPRYSTDAAPFGVDTLFIDLNGQF
jgi:hypothetical protein